MSQCVDLNRCSIRHWEIDYRNLSEVSGQQFAVKIPINSDNFPIINFPVRGTPGLVHIEIFSWLWSLHQGEVEPQYQLCQSLWNSWYWGDGHKIVDVPVTKAWNDVATQCLQGFCEHLEGVGHANQSKQSCEMTHTHKSLDAQKTKLSFFFPIFKWI
jgi:hypothetical protein